jgi:hypothetical protein
MLMHKGAVAYTNVFYLEALQRADRILVAVGRKPAFQEKIRVSE